jgi:acyl-CoA dehydrogenase
MEDVVRPVEAASEGLERGDWVHQIVRLREQATEWGLWLPHMPPEWGGMGLGPTAVAAKTRIGPFVLDARAPDEGNPHTLLHRRYDQARRRG